jgi:DNA excision repair protein ERCC-6
MHLADAGTTGVSVRLVLKHLISPYLLRRQKKDIDEVSRMPGKTEQVLFCRLSKRQRELYEAYLRSEEVTKYSAWGPSALALITILRKICNHPDLVCDPTDAAYESFCKIWIPTCLSIER